MGRRLIWAVTYIYLFFDNFSFLFFKYGSWTYKQEKLDLFIDDSYSRIDSFHQMDISYYVFV
jgi:hypothetical protein